jgi:hypothetical protein
MLDLNNFTAAELSALLLNTKLTFDREGWLDKGAEFVKAKCLEVVEAKMTGYESETQKSFLVNHIALFCIGKSNIFDQYLK